MHKPIILLSCLLCTALQSQAKVIYVHQTATGLNNGSSWQHAYKSPRVALAASLYGDEIWVAEGTYNLYESSGSALLLKSGVALYGGFTGTETLRQQRDWLNHETMFTIVDANMYTLYKILYCENTDSTTVLDGFTITKGFSSISITGQDCTDPAGYWCHGGGLYVYSSDQEHPTSLAVTNCKFLGCLGDLGGGMAVNFGTGSGQVKIMHCRFEKNAGNILGGGLYIYTGLVGQPAVEVDSCLFIENVGDQSAGMFVTKSGDNSDIRVENTIFTKNKPTYSSGAIGIENFGEKKLFIQRCQFIGNKAGNQEFKPGRGGALLGFNYTLDRCSFIGNQGYFGGAVAIEDGEIFNCIFANNYSGGEGGALWLGGHNLLVNNSFFNNYSLKTGGVIQNVAGTPNDTLINCVFWNNHAGVSGNFIGSEGGLELYMDHCLIDADSCEALQEGLFPNNPNIPFNHLYCGTHNLWNVNPALRDTANGDYRLSACSPARNAGDSIWVQRFQLFSDQDGLPRVLEGLPDIGAYETLPAPWTITFTITNATSNTAANGSVVADFVNGGNVPYTYAWSNGVTTPSIEQIVSGIYTLTVTDAIGCTTSLTVEVGFALSVKQQKLNSVQVWLTPNILLPNSPLQIQVQTDTARELTLTVRDLLGRVQFQSNLSVQTATSRHSFTTNLTSGTYYLYLQDANSQSAPLKFVVVR